MLKVLVCTSWMSPENRFISLVQMLTSRLFVYHTRINKQTNEVQKGHERNIIYLEVLSYFLQILL